MHEITIEPRGHFSWARATETLGTFAPVSYHWRDDAEPVRITFPLDGDFTPAAVALRYDHSTLRGEVVGTDRIETVAAQVARIFSLDHDGTGYPAVGERDAHVGRLMAALPGLRPICFTSPYETAAWAVMSQGISMRQAARIQRELTAEYGHALSVAGADVRCFPTPDRLLRVTAVPGLSAEKLERLHGVARAALDGLLDAERLRALGDVAAPAALREISGIGPFWSQGIYLRGCGIVDAFPDEPLAIAALGALYGLGDRPEPAVVEQLTDQYRPYRMWVCFLLRIAAGRGLVAGVAGRESAIRRGGTTTKGRSPAFKPEVSMLTVA